MSERESQKPIRVENHRNQVLLWARRYARYGVPLEELVAAGNCGLCEAASRFDAARGASFATYATWWIRKRIIDALHDGTGNVVGTRFRRQRHARIRSLREHLTELHGTDPEISDLVRETGWRADTVRRSLEPIARLVPLEPADDGAPAPEITRISVLRSVSPLDRMIGRDSLHTLGRALRSLPEREATVLLLRYGFDGARPVTLRRIGSRLGLSSERVRQLEERAIGRLLRALLVGAREARPAAAPRAHS